MRSKNMQEKIVPRDDHAQKIVLRSLMNFDPKLHPKVRGTSRRNGQNTKGRRNTNRNRRSTRASSSRRTTGAGWAATGTDSWWASFECGAETCVLDSTPIVVEEVARKGFVIEDVVEEVFFRNWNWRVIFVRVVVTMTSGLGLQGEDEGKIWQFVCCWRGSSCIPGEKWHQKN